MMVNAVREAMENATTASITPPVFGTLDTIVFACSVLMGGFIGIYFMCFASKGENEESDYLMGGRNMGVMPIALSLVASYISGITLLGFPSEVNVYGCQIMYQHLIYFFIGYVYISQILPVFYNLQGLSLNEYFVKRFDKRLRILGSILYVTGTMGWLPIVIFVPALAYEQVTGYNVHYITPFVCLVCIFYTSIGGIKAVVWTDVIQMLSMIICIVMVAVKGTLDVGGISTIWSTNVASGRIEPPNFDFNPAVRHSIFSVLIGGFFSVLHGGFMNQAMVQRQQTLKTLDRAKRAVWIHVALTMFTTFISQYTGFIIATHYSECDPVSIQLVRAKDQVVPLFVVEAIGHIPGLTGIYIAGIFSAALSSLSTGLNTMSGIFLEDWIRGLTSWNPSEHQAAWIMKIFVIVMGIITVALVVVVEKLGMIIQMSLSIGAMSAGPIMTIFLTGLFLPWVNATGALVGAATAFMVIAPLLVGSQYSISQKLLQFPAKPVSLDGCINIYNVSAEFMKTVTPPPETLMPKGPTRDNETGPTGPILFSIPGAHGNFGDLFQSLDRYMVHILEVTLPNMHHWEDFTREREQSVTRGDVWFMFRISYQWYPPISIVCGITAAILTSMLISRSDVKRIDRRLIAPLARRWLPKDSYDSPERGQHILITDVNKPIKSST